MNILFAIFTSCLNFCSWFWCYGFDRQRKSHRFDAFFESRIRNHWKTEKAKCGKNERSRNPTSQNRGRRKVNIYTWFFLLPLFFVWCKLFIFRVLLYQAVEDLLFKFGYEGKACLLRAICEMHESPLIGYGFFGEVLELFLTWVYTTNSTLCSLKSFLKDRKKGSFQTTNIFFAWKLLHYDF